MGHGLNEIILHNFCMCLVLCYIVFFLRGMHSPMNLEINTLQWSSPSPSRGSSQGTDDGNDEDGDDDVKASLDSAWGASRELEPHFFPRKMWQTGM